MRYGPKNSYDRNPCPQVRNSEPVKPSVACGVICAHPPDSPPLWTTILDIITFKLSKSPIALTSSLTARRKLEKSPAWPDDGVPDSPLYVPQPVKPRARMPMINPVTIRPIILCTSFKLGSHLTSTCLNH